MTHKEPNWPSRIETSIAVGLVTASSALQMGCGESGPSDVTQLFVAPPYESVLDERYRRVLEREARSLSATGRTDTLSEYARKCEDAVGLPVPAFNCDLGTEVPGQGNTPGGTLCERPNVLNSRCDPGSKFQVLAKSADAAVVAHCRKVGLPMAGSEYRDIAVIQYNKVNGAVCFYQALGDLNGSNVRAPSEGESAWAWINPRRTEQIGCTGCHDNGGFIRSPYLTQLVTPPNVLPSTAEGFDNLNTPLRYVGTDYETNRSWSITAPPAPCPPRQACTPCNGCHRLAVNNFAEGTDGTAIDFAMRATKAYQASKVPHSVSSPIWMRPRQVFYSQEAEQAADAFRRCGQAFVDSGFVTTLPGCTATPLGLPFEALPQPPMLAAGRPYGYVGYVPRVVYRGADSHIHEIAIYPETGGWGFFDMTVATGAPAAAGDPMGYFADVPRVVYRSGDGHIHELSIYPETGAWGDFDMTVATGAPPAAGDPMGYLGGVPRVVYRANDGHVHELSIYSETGWGDYNMTASTGAPRAVGDPMGYLGGVPRVVYRANDGHVHEIAIYPETGDWGHYNMTASTGAPHAAGDPMGYDAGVPRVVYRANDGHIHEIAIYPETGDWGHFDMTASTGAPPPSSDPMGYSGEVARVLSRTPNGHIHEIAIYPETGGWGDFDMLGAAGP